MYNYKIMSNKPGLVSSDLYISYTTKKKKNLCNSNKTARERFHHCSTSTFCTHSNYYTPDQSFCIYTFKTPFTSLTVLNIKKKYSCVKVCWIPLTAHKQNQKT